MSRDSRHDEKITEGRAETQASCSSDMSSSEGMQRSRHLGNSMDKQWEAERRGAKRAEARLNNGIQEIVEAQHYHMNSMTKEQKRLQKDLVRIKQATAKKAANVKTNHKTETPQTQATITGKSQVAFSPEGPVMASGSSMTLQMRINDFMDGVKKGKEENLQRIELPLPGTIMAGTKTAPARRPSIVSVTGDVVPKEDLPSKSSGLLSNTKDKAFSSANSVFLRQRRGSLFKEKAAIDEETYAPDGGLRTLHTMPDFMASLEEAKNARYIRHRIKPEFEKELSVGEIFIKEDNSGFPNECEMDNANKSI
ncbi:coiled-coil domain-containing protein 190 isoform X2 [Dendrobates tinctorius]|uniref:coiled-coil domain-containing protein 190 isoform X2 n=1 Tax=Dendrobates tinctorius TaxID=92724 RepID=UPI003CC97B2B